MKKKLFLAILILTVLALLPVRAQSHSVESSEVEDSSKTELLILHYRVNETEVDAEYMNNKAQLHKIRHYFANSPRIDSVTIYSWASPEGGIIFNRHLARERGETAKRLLLSLSTDTVKFNSAKIKLSPVAENWAGLEDLVIEKYFRHDRDKVLKILRDKTIGDETRKWRLQQLDNGYTWRFMLRNYMPELRAATWICVWAEVIEPLPAIAQSKLVLEAEEKPLPVPVADATRPSSKRIDFALKTNLVYDAATAVNYAVEIPLGHDLSIQFQQHTPWWTTRSNKQCLQFLSLGTELRWWFKSEEVLKGHFVGAHAWSGTGDIQWKREGCYQFEFWSAGLTYGYSMPIGKWCNLEFAISAGYASIPYQHYIPTEDWQILIKDRNNAGRLHYWGPTKAEVSFVIPITLTRRTR